MPCLPEDGSPGGSGISLARVLGVDCGEARVGLAISDDLGMLAHPLETIDVRKQNPVKRIAEIARERDVHVIILGMPRNMDGSYGPAADKVREFSSRLSQEIGSAKILTWDERLTTVSASRQLRAAGRDARSQKAVIDQVAAQGILQSWLDAQAFVA